MFAALCRWAVYTIACAALGIQNGVPIAQTLWGRISVAHGRFSRWRRFRMAFLQMASLPDKHENPTSRSSRRGIFSFGNVPDAQVERLAKKFKAHPECLDMTRRRCYDIRCELWDRLSVTSMVGTYKFEHVSFTKLLDCFAGERKNRFIKQCAQPIRLQKRFEFSVLSKAIALQLDALDACDKFEDRLVRPQAAHESGWTTSREAVLGGNSLRLGDVIVACNRAIVVEAFRRGPNSSSSTSPIVLSADLYALDAQVTRSSKAFAITARDVQLRVDQFHMVTVWYFQGDARLVLL